MKAYFLGAAALALGACSMAPNEAQPEPFSHLGYTYPEAVQIQGRTPLGSPVGAGSGVVVEYGVLTNEHVSMQSSYLFAKGADWEARSKGVLLSGTPGEWDDYALLDVDVPDHVEPATLYCGELYNNQRVWSVGYGAIRGTTGIRSVRNGYIASVDTGELPMFSNTVLLDLPGTPGHSGGPVYDADGRVIGLFTGIVDYGPLTQGIMVRPPTALCDD